MVDMSPGVALGWEIRQSSEGTMAATPASSGKRLPMAVPRLVSD
jgi:hypothetical protein